MRIVLNSDILHSEKPAASGLPARLEAFCQKASGERAILVVPRTTLLENQRSQEKLVPEAIAFIKSAVKLLVSYGVVLPEIDPTRLVSRGDLVSLLKATGIHVEIEEPTLEDYRDAEERACLHLPPHPPDTKSDEMRDLIVWAVALRIAKRDGKAILLSRDVVHTHERGGAEAEGGGLLRANSLDEALDFLGQESSAGTLARLILSTVWPTMRAEGVPLPEEVSLTRITKLNFVADEGGHASGSFDLSVNTSNGPFSATVEVLQVAPETIQANLSELRLNNAVWKVEGISMTTKGELPRIVQPEDERLFELRSVLGGN